jgi:hypothetical protein
MGATELFRLPKSYYDEVCAEYESRRDAAYEEISKIPGVVCQKPGGSFYLMAKLPIDNAEDFLLFMLEEFEHKLFVKYEKLLGIEVDTYMTLDRLQDPDERVVLRAYYIDGLQWDQIALKVPCAERTVYDIRLRGLKSVAKILQSDAEK